MMIDRRLAKRLAGAVAGLVVVALFAGFLYGLVSGDDTNVESAGQSVGGSSLDPSFQSEPADDSAGTSADGEALLAVAQVADDDEAASEDDAVVTESALVGTDSDSDSDLDSDSDSDSDSTEKDADAESDEDSDSDSDSDSAEDDPDKESDSSATEKTEDPAGPTTLTGKQPTSSDPTPTESSDSRSSTTANSTTTTPTTTKRTTTKRTTTVKQTTTTSSTTSAPAPASTGGKFRTLPPGSSLPSSSQCASRVRSVAENVPENRSYNQTRGRKPSGTYLSTDPNFDGSSYEARIDGGFTGSTDEIIQWAACKWGFDEDILRAQVYAESSWFAGKLGDCNENTQARTGGQGGCSSVGLIQVRSAGIDRNPHPGLFPISWESSAMNLDYAMAVKRLCFEGEEVWLSDISSSYRAGDEWNCMGRWFSGGWADAGARNYIGKVRQNLNDRPWESQWVGCKDWRESFYCSGISRPTIS